MSNIIAIIKVPITWSCTRYFLFTWYADRNNSNNTNSSVCADPDRSGNTIIVSTRYILSTNRNKNINIDIKCPSIGVPEWAQRSSLLFSIKLLRWGGGSGTAGGLEGSPLTMAILSPLWASLLSSKIPSFKVFVLFPIQVCDQRAAEDELSFHGSLGTRESELAFS